MYDLLADIAEAAIKDVLQKILRPATFFKKRLQHRCFPVNIVRFLRTLIL